MLLNPRIDFNRADTRVQAQRYLGCCVEKLAVRAAIRATPERIWALLTDATAYTRWNSTVASEATSP